MECSARYEGELDHPLDLRSACSEFDLQAPVVVLAINVRYLGKQNTAASRDSWAEKQLRLHSPDTRDLRTSLPEALEVSPSRSVPNYLSRPGAGSTKHTIDGETALNETVTRALTCDPGSCSNLSFQLKSCRTPVRRACLSGKGVLHPLEKESGKPIFHSCNAANLRVRHKHGCPGCGR